MAKPDRETYLFDISKADHIFDYLVKDKQIKLPEGQKIPSADEIKGKKYYKWHHSWTHTTNNCTVFRNSIQKALKESELKRGYDCRHQSFWSINEYGVSFHFSKRVERRQSPRMGTKTKRER